MVFIVHKGPRPATKEERIRVNEEMYQLSKIEFEKEFFYLQNPPTYVQILKDGSLKFLNEQEMEIASAHHGYRAYSENDN